MAFCWVFDLLRQTANIFDFLSENSWQTANPVVNSKSEIKVQNPNLGQILNDNWPF